MCFHARSATASRRRIPQRRQAPPLAMLDLSKPGERQAHEFLQRATSRQDRTWKLLTLRRHEDTLLCVVRWVQIVGADKPYSLAEVSLTEAAVCWRDYPSAAAARKALDRRCAQTHQLIERA